MLIIVTGRPIFEKEGADNMEERDFAREYGIRCRQIRMAKGISQLKLADLMHVTPQAVSKWEKEGVTNVNTVQQLSNVLGQDITADQIDQEGKIGEVGKEILSILVAKKGFVEYEDIHKGLYGMPDDRIGNEIFKLERIGTVVREQYTDYLDQARDSVAITAKGLIVYKNFKEFPDMAGIMETETLEMRLDGEYHSFQEMIEDDKFGKILWKLPYHGAYRIDYIYHLKRAFLNDFPITLPDGYTGFVDPAFFKLKGESCFIDIIDRMIRKENDDSISELMQFYEDLKKEEDIWYDEVVYKSLSLDANTASAQRYLSDIYEELPDFREVLAKSYDYVDEDDEEAVEAAKELQQDETVNDKPEEVFFKGLPKKIINNCAKWFTKEQVEEYISQNYAPASNDDERKIDEMLKALWELDPWALDYFYRFPEEWERNGLATKIRERFGVPAKG